jgi:sugar/nucleoside kinase (ribokinase family)
VRDLRPFADAAKDDFLLILTLGAEGALLLRKAVPPLHDPAPPAHPVDTTGAGDTFTGCFLAAWASGVEPAVALRLAVHGAGRSIEKPGTQEHGLRAGDLLQVCLPATTDGRIV